MCKWYLLIATDDALLLFNRCDDNTENFSIAFEAYILFSFFFLIALIHLNKFMNIEWRIEDASPMSGAYCLRLANR